MINSKTFQDSIQHRYIAIGLLGLFYFLIWMISRLPALESNVINADDYLNFVDHSSTIISQTNCSNPVKDYRLVYVAIRCFSTTFTPEFTLSVWPKVLSGVFLATFSLILFLSGIRWGCSRLISALIPIVLISHPIVNDVTLWNITGVYLLWAVLCGASYHLLSSKLNKVGVAAAILLLLIAVLGYEFYFTVFLLFILAAPIIQTSNNIVWQPKQTLYLLCIFICIAVFYIGQIKFSDLLFPNANQSGRSIAVIGQPDVYLKQKVHGIFNLLVNVFATPISYYTNILTALSRWEIVPISVVVAIASLCYLNSKNLAKSTLKSLAAVMLLITPTLPTFISSQSPESWRTSVPILIGFCFVLLYALNLLYREFEKRSMKTIGASLSILVIASSSFLLLNASHSESKLRVYEASLEKALINQIDDYWADQGVAKENVRVGRIANLGFVEQTELSPAQNLSVSYHKRGLFNNFRIDFAWRGKLINNGLNIVEVDLSEASKFVSPFIKNCSTSSNSCATSLHSKLRQRCLNSPDYTQVETGIRLVHDQAEKISSICL